MFYSFARFIVTLYFAVVYKIKVNGFENIPQTGGMIVCSNHVNAQDPLVIATIMKRKVHFIAKKELYSNRILAAVLGWLGTIPVDRQSADLQAYKKTIKILSEEKVIGIFSQGTRKKELDAKTAKSGVALFALKATVPVVPVCIVSDYRLFSTVQVNIGKAIHLDEYKGMKIRAELLDKVTEDIMTKISSLAM